MSTQRPIVSVILATRNRRAVLEHTLNRLDDCGLDRAELETIVVDNDSTDWTPAAIVDRINRLICLPRNCGSTARAYGADVARGRFLVFLDDDAHPSPGTLERMIGRFESQPGLGAAGFQVHRSGSREDDTALPGVFARCGAGLRAEAYSKSGGLDRTFFMQGEECDLCFRLAMAGWDLEIFDDLHVEHQQTTERRPVDQHLYYGTRNHLRVLARYLPSPFAAICRVDCIQRLGWLAGKEGESCVRAFSKGRLAGDLHSVVERPLYHRSRLSERVFEQFFRWAEIRNRMTELWQSGVNRLLFADLGENIYPFHLAARQLGLQVVAIADDQFAAPGRDYRGTPILPVVEALQTAFDAVVVSNTVAAQAARTAALLALKTPMPIHAWFEEPIPQNRWPSKTSNTSQNSEVQPALHV